MKTSCQLALHKQHAYPNCEHIGDEWWSWHIRKATNSFIGGLWPLLAAALLLYLLAWNWTTVSSHLGFDQETKETLGQFLNAFAVLSVGSIAAYEVFRRLGAASFFKGKRSADYFEDLTSDPLYRIRQLFHKVTYKANRPICIFIDDLDRCNATYVVEFLEGIQTHFRAPNVFYVVAADQKWLRSAFEQRYAGFNPTSCLQAKQPLGLMFLEKIFQLSIGVPDASNERLAAFWKNLLNDRSDEVSIEVVNRVLAEDLDSQNHQIEAAIQAISTEQAEGSFVHHLSQLSDILPNNPRSLKRMVNFYSIYLVSRSIVGATDKTLPTLSMARWIIFGQRFLELSEALLEEPERLNELKRGSANKVTDIISRHAGDDNIRSILGYAGTNRNNPIDPEHIKIMKTFG
ncbi:putative KAP family P-loop domain protein [Pseudovibrio sp. JE062]|nr:putative KAP family P-loop domain protein [Pseudovibrio sp. JE062]